MALKTDLHQLDGVFDYQRSIIIETSMLKNKIDHELLDKIDLGVLEVTIDQLQCINAIYPKEQEMKLLVSKLKDAGIGSFNDAVRAVEQKRLECSQSYLLILKMLQYETNLKEKALQMLTILEMSSIIEQL